jgi:hypothetical protein
MHPALVTAIAATRRQDQLARVAQARRAHEARPGRPARHRQPAPGLRLRARRALHGGLAAAHPSKHQKAGA